MPPVLAEQEALKKAVEFYELDRDLTREQRLELSSFYQKLWVSNILFLYLGFIPGLALPFIMKYRKTGSTKGVNFFWATFCGFSGMMIVPQICSPIFFKSKFSTLQQEKGQNSKEVKIIESLPLFLAVKWAEYYKSSAADSSKIMKDPRITINENRERKPGFLSSGDLFGIKQGTSYGGNTQNAPITDTPTEGISNSWESVRRHNNPSLNQNSYSQKQSNNQDNEEDIFSANPLSQYDDDVQSSAASARPVSSWDSVRRGSVTANGNMIGKPISGNSYYNNKHKKTEQEEFEELLERERNATD